MESSVQLGLWVKRERRQHIQDIHHLQESFQDLQAQTVVAGEGVIDPFRERLAASRAQATSRKALIVENRDQNGASNAKMALSIPK